MAGLAETGSGSAEAEGLQHEDDEDGAVQDAASAHVLRRGRATSAAGEVYRVDGGARGAAVVAGGLYQRGFLVVFFFFFSFFFFFFFFFVFFVSLAE